MLHKLIALAVAGSLGTLARAGLGSPGTLDLRAGIVLSCAVFLLPPLIAFGMVSPLVIRLVSSDLESVGRAAGTVYAVSTAGGVLATFLYGFTLIPFAGMRASSLATAAGLAVVSLAGFALLRRTEPVR